MFRKEAKKSWVRCSVSFYCLDLSLLYTIYSSHGITFVTSTLIPELIRSESARCDGGTP